MDDTERRRAQSRERNRRWRERHPEIARAATRKSVAKWRSENPDAEREAVRTHYAENREAILERKKSYYEDVRKQADKTEAGRMADRDKKARRRSLTKSGTITAEEWKAILEAHGHACAYCKTTDAPLEMDHVLALSKGGQHCAANIVPACKPCNSKKGNR